MVASRLPANQMAKTVAVDPNQSQAFRFDNRHYQGLAGDSLASALLANDQLLVGRSFKYHRPRGLMACGVEEANGLIQLEYGAQTQPDLPATTIPLYEGLEANSQNRWPSLQFDIGALNGVLGRFFPAGFYYKTFMWPAPLWTKFYEKIIRRAAGLGVAPDAPDPSFYSQRFHHCDILIAGGGIAGLYAGLIAGKQGARVVIADEQERFGGYVLSDPELCKFGNQDGYDQVQAWLEELSALPNVTLLKRTTVSGVYDDHFITAQERVQDHLHPAAQNPKLARQRFWKIRAKHLIVAAGAFDRPLVFANNDRPGIMLSSAISGYINKYGVLPGREIALFTNNDHGYRAAFIAKQAGANVRIIDSRSKIDPSLRTQVEALGITLSLSSTVINTKGRDRLTMIEIGKLEGTKLTEESRWVSADCLGSSGGLNPIVHLYSQARGKLIWEDENQLFKPDGKLDKVGIIGAANGTFDLTDLLKEAGTAVKQALIRIGIKPPARLTSPKAMGGDRLNLMPLWEVPAKSGQKAFHDFQNDATAADIHLAAREGFLSIEHLKRYTTTGMATDQGKTSNINAIAIMAGIRGCSIPEVGTTTFRPPYSPISFGAITGQNRRHLFHPERFTPMHDLHQADGAVFEDVGDWKRPYYFPNQNETMHQAVQRECLQTRQSVGMVDASTLGKIDIQGKDAAWFLNMIYTNRWDKLGVGRCRYGLMCNEHGMVFDDGVTTRLDEHHFHMTTTTGGAARVMSWLEEWQQTEWPEREVFFTSVTEQWAVASINGPQSRAMLQALTDIDLSQENFPFMSYKSGEVAGIPARVFRISFTGDLGFEVNVPARFGKALWQALKQAGKAHDLCIYGTETLHILRAEKGFIIAGQDTDGTVTPQDLGMEWAISKQKDDFLGSRSHRRSDTAKEGRKQLVGLLTEDPKFVLPEGAQIVAEHKEKLPMTMIGHVTSSYMSPNVDQGRSIAMALIADGRNRMGEKVNIPDLKTNRNRVATICEPIFFDKEGSRTNG